MIGLRKAAVCVAVLVLCLAGFTVYAQTPADIAEQQSSTDARTLLENGALYRIISADSGKVIQGEKFCYEENAQLKQAESNGELSQIWRTWIQTDGSLILESAAVSGRYLTVKVASTRDGAPAVARQKYIINSMHKGQIWRLDDIAGDGCVIRNVNSGKVLQAQAGSKSAIIQKDYVQGEKAQKWCFEKVAGSEDEIPTLLPQTGPLDHFSTPEIVREGDTYYMYVMTPGIGIKKSTDLKNWSFVQSVFNPDALPEWTKAYTQGVGGGLWAPGVYKINGLYYLYYCASSAGSQKSAIGVAVNTTLDPASPDFKWKDSGKAVITSDTNSNYNAIDPNVITDDSGQAWLVFGSYWEGIYMRKLDNSTGVLDTADTTLYHLAKNTADPNQNKAIEAPYMIKRGDYYYLFSAFGRLEDATYNNCVGRSKTVNGPFLDRDGKNMLDGGGTPVSQGKDGIAVPAHASIFKDTDGQYYFVSEYFQAVDLDKKELVGNSRCVISTIVWDEEGWPVTALSPVCSQ